MRYDVLSADHLKKVNTVSKLYITYQDYTIVNFHLQTHSNP